MTEMTRYETVLLERIQQFTFDNGTEELTFAQRICNENNWPPSFTDRAIAEYKRFLFLAVVAGHPVTPSDQVDQVWHLHITYTRSYWDEMCSKVLERSLHHGPTRGGDNENDKFANWYNRTLESYTSYFEEKPPKDIWPDTTVRFGVDLHYQRINTQKHWIVPIPDFLKSLGARSSGFLVMGSFIACALALSYFHFAIGTSNSIEREMLPPLQADLTGIIFGIIFAFIFTGGMVLVIKSFLSIIRNVFIGNRCPECEKKGTYKSTGKTQKQGFWKADLQQYRCSSCGFSDWKKRSDSGGGFGGGCGSGCGGGG